MDWGVLIGALLLAAVGIFIVWDSRRMRAAKPAPLSRDKMQKGFMPSGLVPWQVLIVLALLSGVFGICEALQPSHPPFTGRHSFVFAWAYELAGERGPAGFCLVTALIFAIAAYAAWRGRNAKG
jgi:hypothetical protein